MLRKPTGIMLTCEQKEHALKKAKLLKSSYPTQYWKLVARELRSEFGLSPETSSATIRNIVESWKVLVCDFND